MTAYSSSLNLRMKDLYDKNYYTPQLPMRTFRNPYFLPTSNQLLFDILKKQSTSTPSAPIPIPQSTTSSVPPSTTGPRRRTGPGKQTIPPKSPAETEESKKAADIQARFNKAVADQKARDAAKASTVKAFSAPPTFTPNETLDARLAKMKKWKASQPPTSQVPTTDKQSSDIMKGNKLLKQFQNAVNDRKFKPITGTLPKTLKQAQSALVVTKSTKPTYNSRLTDAQQSPAYRKWKKQKEDLEDIVKKLSARSGTVPSSTGAKKKPPSDTGAATKPIEKAGKQGDSTKLTDVSKPRFKSGAVSTVSTFPKLTAAQLKTLNVLYKSWKSDQDALANAKSSTPNMRRSVKDKIKFVTKTQDKINKLKQQIVTLEGSGR